MLLAYCVSSCVLTALLQLHPDLHSLEESYLKWLLDTGQEERAGELKEQNGELSSAVSLYMKAGLPAKAARILMSHEVRLWESGHVAVLSASLLCCVPASGHVLAAGSGRVCGLLPEAGWAI